MLKIFTSPIYYRLDVKPSYSLKLTDELRIPDAHLTVGTKTAYNKFKSLDKSLPKKVFLRRGSV